MYGLKTPKSCWENPQKEHESKDPVGLADADADRKVMENQPDNVVEEKEQSKAVVVDVPKASDGTSRGRNMTDQRNTRDFI